MKELIKFIPTIAKAIFGAVVGGGVIPTANVMADNPVIWSWEYMLGALGVGITVYLVPNKKEASEK